MGFCIHQLLRCDNMFGLHCLYCTLVDGWSTIGITEPSAETLMHMEAWIEWWEQGLWGTKLDLWASFFFTKPWIYYTWICCIYPYFGVQSDLQICISLTWHLITEWGKSFQKSFSKSFHYSYRPGIFFFPSNKSSQIVPKIEHKGSNSQKD